jgi:glutamyl-tRNA(Gln) amidotransferase subunit E
VKGDPESVGRVALHLGRILRSTGRVARGLGTIRQDLNVSLLGGKVVEVKGVQKLNLLPKVVEYERARQLALIRVAERLKERGLREVVCSSIDVTDATANSSNRVLRDRVSEGGKVVAIAARGLQGVLGWEPLPDFRLGKEVAEVARANSLGGVIHSDEFERQGITKTEEGMLRALTHAGSQDALVLLAGPADAVESCVPRIVERLREAVRGVPAETRAATETGETRYMRPRPGSQRMYPETDIPNIKVTEGRLRRLAGAVPENWEATISRLAASYSISEDLALKLYDAGLDRDFEALSRELELEPSVVASVLVDIPTRLMREGVPESALGLPALEDVLRAVANGKAAKEAVPDILKEVGKKGATVESAIHSLGLEAADEQMVRSVIQSLVTSQVAFIREKGESAFAPLMGEAMKQLRGKADGAAVARILKEELRKRAQ